MLMKSAVEDALLCFAYDGTIEAVTYMLSPVVSGHIKNSLHKIQVL